MAKRKTRAVMHHPVMKHTRVGGGGIRPKGDLYGSAKGDPGKKTGRK